MAAFRDDPADLNRLDYRLLLNGAVHLYHRPEVLAEDLAWFRAHAYEVYSCDCSRWQSEADLHDDIARTLAFFDGYGRNLDALNDSLGDLAVPDDGGVVFHLAHFDCFAAQYPRVAWALLDIIADNSRRFLLRGRRLLALVQSDDPRLEVAPVGASGVGWNPKEWLQSARGL